MRLNRFIAVFGLGVGVLAGSSHPAQADAIDADWCIEDGRLMSISRTHIVRPGGHRIRGVYDRHGYAYTVPDQEAGAGSRITMILVNPRTIHLWLDEAAARGSRPRSEISYRCSAHVS